MARVLVLDDDLQFSGLLCDLLEVHGHTPRHQGSPAEALETIAVESFDLALVDINFRTQDGLIRENGLFFLREVRVAEEDTALWDKRDLPIIVMSGATTSEKNDPLSLAALSFGANDVLVKPFDFSKMTAAIARVLQ